MKTTVRAAALAIRTRWPDPAPPQPQPASAPSRRPSSDSADHRYYWDLTVEPNSKRAINALNVSIAVRPQNGSAVMVLPRWLTGRSEVESGNAITQELKTAIARALADPTRENILTSLDAQHKATPPVAVDVLRSLPTDQQARCRELVGAFWRAEARGR